MAHHEHIFASEADRQQVEDGELLAGPRGRRLRLFELESIVRRLLVCHSQAERRAVGFVNYCGLSCDEAGARMGVTPERVAEVLASVKARVSEAAERRRRDMVLEKLGNSQEPTGQGCHDGGSAESVG